MPIAAARRPSLSLRCTACPTGFSSAAANSIECACTTCAAGEYQLGECRYNPNGLMNTHMCVPLTVCTQGQFETRAATSTSDRQCTGCRSCPVSVRTHTPLALPTGVSIISTCHTSTYSTHAPIRRVNINSTHAPSSPHHLRHIPAGAPVVCTHDDRLRCRRLEVGTSMSAPARPTGFAPRTVLAPTASTSAERGPRPWTPGAPPAPPTRTSAMAPAILQPAPPTCTSAIAPAIL